MHKITSVINLKPRESKLNNIKPKRGKFTNPDVIAAILYGIGVNPAIKINKKP